MVLRMDGIEKITAQIKADAQQQADLILSQAKDQAEQIRMEYESRAAQETEEILKKANQDAALQEKRLYSMAQLDARKLTLAAKQEMVDKTFQRALELLTGLDDDTYVVLLSGLAASASSTGHERLIFSPEDQKRFGKQVVSSANDILTRRAGVALPAALKASKIGPFLEKLVTGISPIFSGAGELSLDSETRKMAGGFILRDGNVEINCTFEVMLRLARDVLAAEVAECLFN